MNTELREKLEAAKANLKALSAKPTVSEKQKARLRDAGFALSTVSGPRDFQFWSEDFSKLLAACESL